SDAVGRAALSRWARNWRNVAERRRAGGRVLPSGVASFCRRRRGSRNQCRHFSTRSNRTDLAHCCRLVALDLCLERVFGAVGLGGDVAGARVAEVESFAETAAGERIGWALATG